MIFIFILAKVAEQLINPFGDDDEDFELNWLIDRHTKVIFVKDTNILYKIYISLAQIQAIRERKPVYLTCMKGFISRGRHFDEPLPSSGKGHLL